MSLQSQDNAGYAKFNGEKLLNSGELRLILRVKYPNQSTHNGNFVIMCYYMHKEMCYK